MKRRVGRLGELAHVHFDANPCLAEQVTWARAVGRVSYDVNTANPGPRLSDHWPLGQTSPRHCMRAKYLRNDTAVLAGMRRALLRRGVRAVGAYSTQHQWVRITGGASLDEAPVWYAGVGSKSQARRRCRPAYSFTGGQVRMTQFLTGSGLDGDLRC